MTKKEFFRDRTVAEIKRLGMSKAAREEGLVEKISSLEEGDGLEIRVDITPERFFNEDITERYASRMNLKHGRRIGLDQPRHKDEARRKRETPARIISRSFRSRLGISEGEIEFIGYKFWPVQGRDRLEREVIFAHLLEGARIYAYAASGLTDIETRTYADSLAAKKEGASIVCTVPSRSRKERRYEFRLDAVPVWETPDAYAIAWGIGISTPSETERRTVTPHNMFNMRYTSAPEGSRRVVFDPHHIAGYMQAAEDMLSLNETTTLRMTPFPYPSEELSEFYMRLRNNVIKHDRTLRGRKLRHLHLDEISMLLARKIGSMERPFWSPDDPKLREYKWSIQSVEVP